MAGTSPLAAPAVDRPALATQARKAISVGAILRQVAFQALLLAVAFIALFPIAWLLTGSLQTIQELYGGVTFWPAVPQFQNYYIAWTKGGFSVFIPNSLFYST